MIIKEISAQSFDENEERPYLIRNSKDYTIEQWKMIIKYLKINKKEKLLNYEVVER